jgi:hypothetical protein
VWPPRLIIYAAIFALAFVADARAGERGAITVDGLAAVVGPTVSGADSAIILNSDVELLAHIAICGAGSNAPGSAALPSALLKAVLNEIIGEHLIAREAERVRIAAPGPAEMVRERLRLEAAAGGVERFQRLLAVLSVSPAEIDKIVHRRALLTAFLSANLEVTTAVTDSEVDRAYEKFKDSLSDHTPVAAKEILRARLARAALDRSIARWVTVLRARTPVRLFATYAR